MLFRSVSQSRYFVAVVPFVVRDLVVGECVRRVDGLVEECVVEACGCVRFCGDDLLVDDGGFYVVFVSVYVVVDVIMRRPVQSSCWSVMWIVLSESLVRFVS